MEHLLTLKEKRLEELTKHRTGGTAAGSGGGGASAEYHHKQYSR
jgi:hypothetical protein